MKLIFDKIKSLASANKDRVTVIGIDGPTAAGKTTLANHIKDFLSENNIECWIFRLDWTLLERQKRIKDLAHMNAKKAGFDFEAELHMNLNKASDFLRQVMIFNQKEDLDDHNQAQIALEGLYNREDNGQLSGSEKVNLIRGMVILIEGHYTLRNHMDRFIDLNILLLGDYDELLKRKANRVKDYRNQDEAIDYFWRIDVPSFRNHLKRFGNNADITIDNTDYNNPVIDDSGKIISEWINIPSDKVYPKLSLNGQTSIGDFVFSNSILVAEELKTELERTVCAMKELDNHIGRYLRINIQSLKNDVTELVNNTIAELNKNMSNGYSVKLMHTDSLYNIYYRRLPFSICLGLFYGDDRAPAVSLLADIFQSELSIQIIWAGGYKCLSMLRMLGEISEEINHVMKDSLIGLPENNGTDQITVFLPTDFTFPTFLKKYEPKLVYIRKEDEVISPSQLLKKSAYDQGVWIQRFAFFSEASFFQDILSNLGVQSIQVGSYLISVGHSRKDLLNDFNTFVKEWERPIIKEELFKKANDEMDKLVIEERDDAKEFVRLKCPLFSMMDGYLFSDFMYGDDSKIEEGLENIRLMLTSKNRLLRKRATQFILKYFPMLSLPTDKLWENLPEGVKKEIFLESYNKISPSIMAEIYLWLALRKERSSILACNIYDIRKTSIDSISYLDAAAKNNMPILLQCSMNAAGQKEIGPDGKTYEGYLHVPGGPKGFIDAAFNSARDLFLTKGILPLFGIGLDHVNSELDYPEGRCKRFLEMSVKTGLLTHYVPDGESLLHNNHTGNVSNKSSGYDRMAKFSAELTYDLKSLYLVDRELCAGELNYSDKPDEARIQTVEEMKSFMRSYQKYLEQKNLTALLSRPMLFIGNLGTVHHGYDKTPPAVEQSQKWRDSLKCENFVSPVLHGTTDTHREVLQKAANGCHKINVAGGFLNIMIENLPEGVSRIIYESKVDHKRMISSVRHLMDHMRKEEFEHLRNTLTNSCTDLLSTINSPKLTSRDISYFQYQNYKYVPEHIGIILEQIRVSINRYKKPVLVALERNNKPNNRAAFCASMIEVPAEKMEPLIEVIWNNGVKHFHIDAGDGKFIPRKFSGIEKAQMIKKKYKDSVLHAHLMVENPHFPQEGKMCQIEQYIKAGCEGIAVHPRAFSDRNELFNAISLIKNLGARAGIMVETSDSIDNNIVEIIARANIDWVVVMGVPVGYGGQIFQFTTLQTISNLNELFKLLRKEYMIEVDGGLTFQTIELCKNAGATLFSGWSIVKSNDLRELESNIKRLNKLLHDAA